MNALIPVFAVVLLLAAPTLVHPVWITWQGIRGLAESRELPPPSSHRAASRDAHRTGSQEKPAEKQLLEVVERKGEIKTPLTVDEAERLLSELAQRGHLDVRVEGSKLVYPL